MGVIGDKARPVVNDKKPLRQRGIGAGWRPGLSGEVGLMQSCCGWRSTSSARTNDTMV